MTPLTAISPIDGRYHSKTKQLAAYFSEEALIRYRVKVEVEYFIALCEISLPQLTDFNTSLFDDLRAIYKNFSTGDALKIKNHLLRKNWGGSQICVLFRDSSALSEGLVTKCVADRIYD